MKSNIKLYTLIFSMLFLFNSCQENDYQIGDVKAPTNIELTATIVGQDAMNPNGDGSGIVNFTANADNAITYTFNFDDGTNAVANSNGVTSHRFTRTGVNTYNVVVNVSGVGGVSSSKIIPVQVFSSFEDVEAENFLSGANVGDSKKWYWAANVPTHVGLGPVTDDYGNGEFAYEAWWNAIQPWDAEKFCMYDNEFVFTRTVDGITFEQTVGPAFVPGAYASTIGVGGDQCYDQTVATNMFGVKNVSFAPSSSKAAVEGTYNNEPYRKTTFSLSDGGFMGWFVGASEYDIISISNTEMVVRIIQDGGGFAWYHKFVSTKPVQGSNSYTFNNLVWEDDFNTDGAPDATKWTYDLGAGGWGNGESQHYTDRADNAVVQNGNLVITAKKENFSGSNYTSARLKSQGLYEFKYGRVEIKAKLPAGQGTWPALWMLGANFPTVGWPHSGEIDIMEQTGSNKNEVLATTHWFDSANSQNASFGTTTAITNATSEFHIYTLEWTEDNIKIYLDDVEYYSIANNANLPFDADFFLIMNIAMGGTLGGTIDAGFTEATMEVDYVKVFQ